MLCVYHTFLVATSQTTKEHIKATYLVEPNPHHRKPFINFWNLFCRGRDSHVCRVLPQWISKWLLFLKYNSGNASKSVIAEISAPSNEQVSLGQPSDDNYEHNSSRITTGENQQVIDPEQAHLYFQPQQIALPSMLHQESEHHMDGMQTPREEANSALQVTSRSLTFAADGPQFEGNMDSFNQRIEMTALSFEYVNIIPINHSSNSGESKES